MQNVAAPLHAEVDVRIQSYSATTVDATPGPPLAIKSSASEDQDRTKNRT